VFDGSCALSGSLFLGTCCLFFYICCNSFFFVFCVFIFFNLVWCLFILLFICYSLPPHPSMLVDCCLQFIDVAVVFLLQYLLTGYLSSYYYCFFTFVKISYLMLFLTALSPLVAHKLIVCGFIFTLINLLTKGICNTGICAMCGRKILNTKFYRQSTVWCVTFAISLTLLYCTYIFIVVGWTKKSWQFML